MQVAFTDLLTHLGITPNGIIGMSLGEFSAAYADGCSTLEQTVLAAYWRGHSIMSSKIIPSTTANVGLSLIETLALIPSDVFLSFHTTFEKLSICGPIESISECVNKLTNKGIYAKTYDGSTPTMAFHSEYMAEAGAKQILNL